MLYLDGDTLCVGSLKELADLNLQDKLAAVVLDIKAKDWSKSVFRWRQAILQFVVMFGDRFKQG